MDNWEISDVLSRHLKSRHVFVGCYPSNAVPLKDQYPYAMVINTDCAKRKGRHWVAIFVPSPSTVEYFDSFGAKPNTNIRKFVKKFLIRHRNNVCFQSVFSDVCGLYCIYFIIKRCSGERFFSIVNHLRRKRCPDTVVKLFCSQLFK